MNTNKSFNINLANHRLYHALMEALIEDENAMDKGVADMVKDHKKKHDDDEDPPAGPNQGSKTGKSAPAKEPVEEPITEVIIDDAGDDVARDDNPPQDTTKPKTRKTLNPEWFKQPLRPPTPDPEWNKRQVVLDQPVQPWFNQLVSALKDPLTFNDLMTCLEIEYNFQECFNTLTNKLDWNNLEGDHYPFDLSKPLPLQGLPCHRTITADYFFNNDLEYLKTSDPEITYTTSITKTKATYVRVKKLHEYGHLEAIVVKRSDQQLYTFKEGNIVDLHLNDIEDMLLLVVQHKLFHLDGNIIVDFIVVLQPYTPSYDPPGIVYEDQNKHKRVLRADELYKFSDGTLKSIRDEIHHRVLDFRLDYNTEMPKRKWTVVDRRRSRLMVELIDKQLREREIIRNQERLVGARELEMDYKLMMRTVPDDESKSIPHAHTRPTLVTTSRKLKYMFQEFRYSDTVHVYKNGVNPPAPNLAHNSNFSLLSVLGMERLTGPNYMDWMRNLRFILRYENKEYVLDEQIPTIDDDSTQEEIEAHQKHYDDANEVSCIMASSMSPELQKPFENAWAYEMNQQLKEMFQAKASKEHLDFVKSSWLANRNLEPLFMLLSYT
ncbi:hypothetical protein Tco_1346792 [Tanacetum coccineum]